MEQQPIIQLESIKKVFYTDEVETHALSDIHLEVQAGEYLAIAGPSGCGKSTLLSLLGLLDSATEGSYHLDGQPVVNLTASQRAQVRNRQIGFIFQAFNLIGDLTVIRASIDLYTTEHVGGLPTLANFVSQMIQFSDVNGNTSATKTGLFIYGPYLRQIPPLPVGAQKGLTGIKASPADGVGAFGWTYSSGMIFANTAAGEVDDSGKPYNTY